MKRKHIGFIIAILVLAACGVYYLIQKNSSDYARVLLNGTSFAVRIADSEVERTQGLGGTTFLDVHEGMLFVFDVPGDHTFWMKDMQIIIDIVWLDADWNVVHIEKAVAPETYPKTFSSPVASQYVLEVPAGTVETVNLQVGDVVTFIDVK